MYGQTGAGKTFTMLGTQYQSEIKDIAPIATAKRAASSRGLAIGVKTPMKNSFSGNLHLSL